MTPNATHYKPDPVYLRTLVAKAGISQREAARRIGVPERTFRAYLSPNTRSTALAAPYAVQFCLEALAGAEA